MSPVDAPVSPIGSEWAGFESDESTISPISPETPFGGDDDRMLGGLNGDGSTEDSSRMTAAQKSISDLEEQLQGVRLQLQSHLKLLREAKQRTVDAQTQRSAARKAPTKSGQLASFLDASGTRAARLQQSHSFWSFTPEDVKLLEKQRRIEDGRRRGWMRARFDATRYSDLAERAMAEL